MTRGEKRLIFRWRVADRDEGIGIYRENDCPSPIPRGFGIGSKGGMIGAQRWYGASGVCVGQQRPAELCFGKALLCLVFFVTTFWSWA